MCIFLILSFIISFIFYIPFFSSIAFGQEYDLIRMVVRFIPNEYSDTSYNSFSFQMSNNNESQICPSGTCIFQLQGGTLWYGDSWNPDTMNLDGILRIGTVDISGAIRFKIYDIHADLQIIETTETQLEKIHTVGGTILIGDRWNPVFTYEIYSGIVTDKLRNIYVDINAQSIFTNPYGKATSN